jgi:hypothetical protein
MEAEGFVGIGKTRAFQLIKQALDEAIGDQSEAAHRLVALEMLRLDDMTKGLYVAARKGEPPAVNSMLNVMDRRAKLAGLDAPTRTDATFSGKAGAPPIQIKESMDDASKRFVDKVARAVAAAAFERASREPDAGGDGGSAL